MHWKIPNQLQLTRAALHLKCQRLCLIIEFIVRVITPPVTSQHRLEIFNSKHLRIQFPNPKTHHNTFTTCASFTLHTLHELKFNYSWLENNKFNSVHLCTWIRTASTNHVNSVHLRLINECGPSMKDAYHLPITEQTSQNVTEMLDLSSECWI